MSTPLRDIQRILDKYRGNPGIASTELATLYNWLVKVVPNSHWFCSRGLSAPLDQSEDVIDLTDDQSGPGSAPPSSTNQQQELVREAATYLIVLHAMQSSITTKWKGNMVATLSSCEDCVEGYHAAKDRLKNIYLVAHPPSTLENFFNSVSAWETQVIVDKCSNAAIDLTGSAPIQTSSSISLSNLPPSLIHLILMESALPTSMNILPLLLSPSPIPSTYRPNRCPVLGQGLLQLLIHPTQPTLHKLGLALLPSSETVDSSRFSLSLSAMSELLDLISDAGVTQTVEQEQILWETLEVVLKIFKRDVVKNNLAGSSKDSGSVSGGKSKSSLLEVVCSHLSDKTKNFPIVLRIATTLFETLSLRFWRIPIHTPGQLLQMAPPSSSNILATILENPAIQSSHTQSNNNFCWVKPFVESLLIKTSKPEDHSAVEIEVRIDRVHQESFDETLKRIMLLLLETCQHIRFDINARRIAVEHAFEVIITLQSYIKSSTPKSPPVTKWVPTDSPAKPSAKAPPINSSILSGVLEIYATIITSVSFAGKDHKDNVVWSKARSQGQEIISFALEEDAWSIVNVTTELGLIQRYWRDVKEKKDRKAKSRQKLIGKAIEAGQKPPKFKEDDEVEIIPTRIIFPRLEIRSALWEKSYEAVSLSDARGIALFVKAVSIYSHIDVLENAPVPSKEIDKDGKQVTVYNSPAWTNEFLPEADRSKFKGLVSAINQHIVSTRDSLPITIERFTYSASSQALLNFWNLPCVTQSAACLLLSPVESIHTAVQALVLQTWDFADGRAECFRAVMSASPAESCEGLIQFLEVFTKAAQSFPEACLMAKFMVRCFTDIIEGLCIPPKGLLRQQNFVEAPRMKKLLPTLWQLMCKSLSVIFHNTRRWAIFYENKEMVDWMTDALIFGRLLTAEIRCFENAVIGKQMEESMMSGVGKKMVDSLGSQFLDLTGWMRLSDEETLHQSFELLKALLLRFLQSKMEPEEEVLSKLNSYALGARHYETKLTGDQRASLSHLLSQLDTTPVIVERPLQSSASSIKRSQLIAPTDTQTTNDFKAKLDPSKGASKASSFSSSRPSSSKKAQSDDEFDFPELTVQEQALLDKTVDMRIKSSGSSSSSSRVKQKLPTTAPPPLRPSSVIPKALKSHTVDKGPKFSSSAMGQLRQSHAAERAALPKLPAPRYLGSAPSSKLPEPKSEAKLLSKPEISDSDEDSSESDSSEDEGMSSLAQKEKKRSPVKQLIQHVKPQRSIKTIGLPEGVSDRSRAMQQRQVQQRTKLRIQPDLNALHKFLLQWLPGDLSDIPPNLDRSTLKSIPDRFSSPEHYEAIMEPLLLLECWAQVTKANEDSANTDVVTCDVDDMGYVDDWLDVEMTIPDGELPGSLRFNETDVVILTPYRASQGKQLYAKVQNFKKSMRETTLTVRLHTAHDLNFVTRRSKWEVKKHYNLSTMHREYAGLKGMPYYDQLLSSILKGQSNRIRPPSPDQMKSAMSKFSVNEPQAKAILGAMDPQTQGFVLIQGPPGTGKTKTICGLAAKFLSDRKKPATKINAGSSGEVLPVTKLLVCAPSNAAIDEVTKRLKEGVVLSNGQRYSPKIVRLGLDKSMNISVKDISLDELVDQKLSGTTSKSNDTQNELVKHRRDLDEIKVLRESKIQELNEILAVNPAKAEIIQNQIRELGTKRMNITQKLNKARDKQKDTYRSADALRRQYRAEVLRDADIICATLSGAGQPDLAALDFETVIIDEAAQAVEVSSLIPLKYNCRRCIMVGDPLQLPPTVISERATELSYNQSLFVRIQRQAPDNVHLLTIQYRMHPEISVLPSDLFYNGRLLDGPEMAEKTLQPWHKSAVFGPYHIINVANGQETGGINNYLNSKVNNMEAEAIVKLYKGFLNTYPNVDFDYRVGIITMYRAQMVNLRNKFRAAFGEAVINTVDFNTVDGFQGQEKDIIILSCVRAGPASTSIGFLADKRRMNVALTRARSSLFVFGNVATLQRSSSESWKKIIENASARGLIRDYAPNVFNPLRPSPSKPGAPKKVIKDISGPSQLKTAFPEMLPPKLGPVGKTPASNKKRPSGDLHRSTTTTSLSSSSDKKPKLDTEVLSSSSATGLSKADKQPKRKREETDDVELPMKITTQFSPAAPPTASKFKPSLPRPPNPSGPQSMFIPKKKPIKIPPPS